MSSMTSELPRSASTRREQDNQTFIGVDVGEKTLVAATPANGDLEAALLVDGGTIQRQYATLADVCDALDAAAFETDRGRSQILAALWRQIRPEIVAAAERTIAYAETFHKLRLVLEDLGHASPPLWRDDVGSDCGTWLLPLLQEAIIGRAQEVGIGAITVDTTYSSQACHECGTHGDLGRATLLCTNDDCPVERVDRDASAAATLAQRPRENAEWIRARPVCVEADAGGVGDR
jgi:putative transposase